MKNLALFCGLTLLALAFAAPSPPVAMAGDSFPSASGWFDFENCAFCKNLMEEPGLMAHSTWENHPIANGMINIMTVEPDYATAMATAETKMSALGAKMQSGRVNPMSVEMCGHCQSFGMLMMSGAKVERIEGDAAIVTLITSDDPALVTRLQEQATRDTKEMALVMEQEHHQHQGH